MFTRKLLMPGLIALGVAFGAANAVTAAEPHSHAGTTPVALKLDNGKKWQTDESLRRGMADIRQAMAKSLDPIHRKAFSAKQYEALAGRVQTQVDFITANCKLPEEADAQLHIVLEQILDGIAELKGKSGQAKGAVKIVGALDNYGKYFNDTAWKPLAH